MKRSSCASGSGVRAFELDRVLRGEDEKRLIEWIGASRGGDVVLLHRFEQRRLRLRRRAVDFVGEDDLREDRTLDETQPPGSAFLVENLRAGDVGRHQIGRELNAFEIEIEDVRDRLDQQGFREARHAGDQAVPAGEECDQYLLHHLVLSDDHFPKLVQNALAAFCDTFGAESGGIGGVHGVLGN
jgi:hypothetical protein